MITTENFTRINNCVNGNPRYVLHFLNIADDYNTALSLARECGGKAYKGKNYGGGIVFSTYSLPNLISELEHIKMVGLPIKATVRSYKGYTDIFYYANGELLAWGKDEGHGVVSLDYYRETKPLDKAQAIEVIKHFNYLADANLIYSSRLSHH